MERITEQPGVLENVITCDETWIFQYDPQTKRQLMHWKTPTSLKKLKKLNSAALVRKRTIPIKQLPLVGEVSANLTENEISKNEQVESEGNDDHFLRHQRRNHD
jgi:hypothetical protein